MKQIAVPPDAPPLIDLAKPSPAIAFALPTTGPAQIVSDPKSAVPTKPTTATTAPASAVPNIVPAVHRLVYGQGEGRQPAPEYPREAVLARQQGTVIVRFTVDEAGRVVSAAVAEPCPFAILNQAAVRAVSESWRFSPGPARSYEVSIEFQLKQRK